MGILSHLFTNPKMPSPIMTTPYSFNSLLCRLMIEWELYTFGVYFYVFPVILDLFQLLDRLPQYRNIRFIDKLDHFWRDWVFIVSVAGNNVLVISEVHPECMVVIVDQRKFVVDHNLAVLLGQIEFLNVPRRNVRTWVHDFAHALVADPPFIHILLITEYPTTNI